MKMRLTYYLLFVLVISALHPSVVPAQSPPSLRPGPESQRIERLAALGKVWGTVKYFHPYLAYRKIDWDGALIAAIPKVNAARSAEEYAAAVNGMLSVLRDPNTVAKVESTAPSVSLSTTEDSANPASAPDAPAKYFHVTDGVLVVEVMALARWGISSRDAFYGGVQEIISASTKQNAVVWDMRGRVPTDSNQAGSVDYLIANFVSAALGSLVNTPVVFGSVRYRVQSGYAPQLGPTSGGYYSALVTNSPPTAPSQADKQKPLAVIIDQFTPDVGDRLSGLQVMNAATVIQAGPMVQELGAGTYTMELPDGVKARIRTTELVNPDGSVGFHPDQIIAANVGSNEDAPLAAALKAVKQPIQHTSPPSTTSTLALNSYLDDPYATPEFPDPEHRMLALFRFWNVINYFFPYKHLLEGNWDDILTRYIPLFEANKDVLDYQRTASELVTNIHDSHAHVGGQRLNDVMGRYFPPFAVRLVEGKTVVARTNEASAAAGLKVGDVVESVDADPVAIRLEREAKLLTASTPQSLSRDAHFLVLRGAKDSKAVFTVRGADGKSRQVELARTVSIGEYYAGFYDEKHAEPVYTVLPSGIGYIDLSRLTLPDVDQAMDTVMKTPAVIFDMRGYPNGTAWSIAPRLTNRRNVVGAWFRRPFREAINLGSPDYAAGSEFAFPQELPPPIGAPYLGKVVVLINEYAISQAEHTCLFFEAATKVAFVGTPTVGANGDVTTMVLPGNIGVSFTGHDVRHADGRQLQRLGIQPDIKVAPTIKGIRAGRDEILEAAIKYVQNNPK